MPPHTHADMATSPTIGDTAAADHHQRFAPAHTLLSSGRYAAAIPAFQEAMAALEAEGDTASPLYASTLAALGESYCNDGRESAAGLAHQERAAAL